MSVDPQLVACLRQRLARIREQIHAALVRSGQPERPVTIVGVSKTVPPEMIRAAVEAGLWDLGENRVQEARAKMDALAGLPIRWHMVGHLQRNKVRFVVNSYALIHSLDRLALAQEIDRRARHVGRPQDCLVQVNVSGEPTKSGLAPEEVFPFLEAVAGLEGVRVRGLMTIAPLTDDPEAVRPVFRRLRELADEIRSARVDGVSMEHLSMGMSDDYPVAVEEGATIVRIGRALFGPRPA